MGGHVEAVHVLLQNHARVNLQNRVSNCKPTFMFNNCKPLIMSAWSASLVWIYCADEGCRGRVFGSDGYVAASLC